MNRRGWGKGGRGGRGGRGGHGGRGGRGNWNRNHNTNRYNKSFHQAEQLTEHEVGITEYISDIDGFSAVIKARYSDFHVNEIDPNGDVAKFTNNKIPEVFAKPKVEAPPNECPIDEITQEQWDDILQVVGNTEGKTVRIDVTEVGKEKRTELHQKIKRVFGDKIVSSTVIEEEKKFIELKKYMKEDKRSVFEWPKGLGEYVHFLLYKESMDTMDAVMRISDIIRMPASAFNYAGVKDRRAKTTQWISVRKVEPWKLIHKTRPIHNVKIGNLTFKDTPLKLGHLKGNVFRIALRNITAEDELIENAMENLKSKGFINYYGLQRFGNDKEVPTYDIGIQLLKGCWKDACNLILKLKKNEDPLSDIGLAKKVYQETQDAKKACLKLGRYSNSSIESKLLNGLAKTGKNEYVNALETIPRNTRLLYIHSFQSLIWNYAVSKRVKDFGLNPIVGDIVLVNDSNDAVDNDLLENEGNVENTEEDTNNETEKQPIQEIKVLTEDDLKNYTIYDVVLPLPGYDITYPENAIKDYYKELLEKYGLELEMAKQSVKTYTLSGNYRKIMTRVTDLTWKTILYNDPNDTLIRSDFEEILGHKEPESAADGKYKGLIVTFSLPASCYATMVLREFLKIDTSRKTQSKLNNYHEKNEETQPAEAIVNESSLLSDKDKFEAFKKAIFESTIPEEPTKRKIEDDEETLAKKPKLDDPEKETGIKIQASLV